MSVLKAPSQGKLTPFSDTAKGVLWPDPSLPGEDSPHVQFTSRQQRGRRAKRAGAETERRVQRLLEADGWAVSHTGGSLGVWDLIAISERGVRLIQVKGGRRAYCSPAERAELARQVMPPCGCVKKQLWRLPRYARTPIIVEL